MAEVLDTVETPQQAARRLSAQASSDGFKPEALHVYTDANGAPLFWRIRARHPDGRKWIRPMRRTADGTRYEIGEPPAPPARKPLYNLHRIAADTAAVVFVAEGEWAADALAKLGVIATTSGGAQSADAAAWEPLRGRAVLIWPDHGEPGAQYCRDVADKLRTLGCAVQVIDVEPLALPPKGDAFDWCSAHPDAAAADVLALAVVQAEECDWPQPQPLVAQIAPEPYPLDALPPRILAAVQEVQSFALAPVALVASAALSAVSVAVQGLYDILLTKKRGNMGRSGGFAAAAIARSAVTMALFLLGLLPAQPLVITGLGVAAGLGFGTVRPTAQLVVQIVAGRSWLGAAAARVSLARSTGAAVGAAVFGALGFGMVFDADLQAALHASDLAAVQQVIRA